MDNIVQIILETILGAFTSTLSAIGQSLNDIFTSIFLTSTVDPVTSEVTITGLSPVAGWSVAFFAIGLVLGIIYKFVNRI